ncbi:MAG: hypothetical protein MUP36_03430 [Demequinaceae bacterium]|nr:hypothetical protein [Demequinaceae bacterium]
MRRRVVEHRLSLGGLLLLGLSVVGFVALMLLSSDDRWDRQSSDAVGFVLLGLLGITALWWGLICTYWFRTERVRLKSILKSHLQSDRPPAASVQGPDPSQQGAPAWRAWHKAILFVAVSLSVVAVVVFIVALIKDRQILDEPGDYWNHQATFAWRFFALVVFLACCGIVIRILVIRRADLAHATRNQRVLAMSGTEATSLLRTQGRESRRSGGLWRAALGWASPILSWGPRPRQPEAPAKEPSTEDLKHLYSRQRAMRLAAYGLLLLAPLLGLFSHSIYDSACPGYYRPYCMQIHPEAVTTSLVVGVICILTFIAAASFWWRAVVLQIRTTRLEGWLSERERLREGATGQYPLEDPPALKRRGE